VTESVPLTFGEELRRERVIREISLEEISAATKISLRLLTALEASDVSRLPAPTFTRGFIRAYARHLGLDPEEMVNAYLQDVKSAVTLEAPSGKKGRSRSRFLRGRRATAGTIVGGVTTILLFLGLIASPERRPLPSRPRIAPPAEPVAFKNVSLSTEPAPAIREDPAPVEPQVEEPAARVSLLLECDEDSWAKLTADGETVFSGLIRRGESRRFEAREGFRLTLGNAGGVRVTIDGRPLDRLGGDGEVIRDLPLPGAPLAERG
jgi:cytoskeleton protein RodZ